MKKLSSEQKNKILELYYIEETSIDEILEQFDQFEINRDQIESILEIDNNDSEHKQAERIFQEEKVVPWLEAQGHKIHEQNKKITGRYPQNVDILSCKERQWYVTEVKLEKDRFHGLQRAIGQLILHQYNWQVKGKGQLICYMILPKEEKTPKYSMRLIEFLKDTYNISINFI